MHSGWLGAFSTPKRDREKHELASSDLEEARSHVGVLAVQVDAEGAEVLVDDGHLCAAVISREERVPGGVEGVHDEPIPAV